VARINLHDEVMTPDGNIGVVIGRFFIGKQALYKVSVKFEGARTSYSEISDFKRTDLKKSSLVGKNIVLPKLVVAK
jgi:hypothetical protein